MIQPQGGGHRSLSLKILEKTPKEFGKFESITLKASGMQFLLGRTHNIHVSFETQLMEHPAWEPRSPQFLSWGELQNRRSDLIAQSFKHLVIKRLHLRKSGIIDSTCDTEEPNGAVMDKAERWASITRAESLLAHRDLCLRNQKAFLWLTM
ncbi:hypothetical protein J6590_044757 [Homalodisca vitripennis]|nr:hypothetical protein J6590_044757 [Homalodisca vitripennis]